MSGPDIFLSYAHPDAGTARLFADALAAEGFDVWWDNDLRSGEVFDEKIEAALRAAKAVIVLWSPQSVISRWVRAEATLADRNKTLVPVTIAPCERPIVFELFQTAELSHWQGDGKDAGWLAFVREVKDFLGAPAANPSPAERPAPLPALDQVSILVLPFANMSRDDDQEYFADGITEDIITDLSKISALAVIARNTAFTFKGKTVDIRQVSGQLNVTHVLEGSVRKAGNRVRITAQLIDGATGNHQWAERWDRELDDIFAIQDEISAAIVGALELKLLPGEKKAIAERSAASFEAYDLFLRARAFSSRSNSGEDFMRANEMFNQVLALDPGFAEARAEAAMSLQSALTFTASSIAGDLLEEMGKQAAEAKAQAPGHWGSHLAAANWHAACNDWLGAVDEFELAVRRAPPVETLAHCRYGLFLAHLGRVTDSLAELQAARAINPLDILTSFHLQLALTCCGRVDEAEREYLRTGNVEGFEEPRGVVAMHRIWPRGDRDLIKERWHAMLGRLARPSPILEGLYGVLDQPEAARALLHEAFADPANDHAWPMLHVGVSAALFGETELSVAALRRSFIVHGNSAWSALWLPTLHEVRLTPAFKQFAIDYGFADYWRKSGHWGDFVRPLGDGDFEIFA